MLLLSTLLTSAGCWCRAKQQYDVVIVDQVSVVVPLLKLLTRAKVEAAEPCINAYPNLQNYSE